MISNTNSPLIRDCERQKYSLYNYDLLTSVYGIKLATCLFSLLAFQCPPGYVESPCQDIPGCIDTSLLCNLISDCADSSDEAGCNTSISFAWGGENEVHVCRATHDII